MKKGNRSQTEIDDLKVQWIRDPSGNLADAPGFEAYRDELETFQRQAEELWQQRWNEQLIALSEKFGCSNNLRLTMTIRSLLDRIEKLEARLRQGSEHAEH